MLNVFGTPDPPLHVCGQENQSFGPILLPGIRGEVSQSSFDSEHTPKRVQCRGKTGVKGVNICSIGKY